MSDSWFAGKSVLVAGGSSGIGNGIARGFAAAGAHVTIWGTRPTAADYARDDLAGMAYRQVDVADRSAIAAAAAEIPALDVLVLSQGIAMFGGAEFDPASFNHVLSVNLEGSFNAAAALVDPLERSRGSVVFISSIAAYRGGTDLPAYSASKAGLLGLVRSLARSWASRGVRVNGIAPGFVDTKLTNLGEDPDRLAGIIGTIPLGRIGLAEDMAAAAMFLGSSQASYITGQTLVVDGGYTL